MTIKPLSRGKKSGRSRKAAPPGSKVSLGLRVTAEAKARIDAAALTSGRSQSEEATWRIERSFDREDLLPDVLKLAFGELGLIVLLLAYEMQHGGRLVASQVTPEVERWQSDAWLMDPTGYDRAVKAANRALEMFRPPGEIDRTAVVLDVDDLDLPNPEEPYPRPDHDLWQLFRQETIKRVNANLGSK
jgi:hypothetical protein